MIASGAALLGLLPLANIARIVATTGGNTPSSDDEVFVSRFIGPILDGTYRWPQFFRDSFHNTHADYFPGLLYLLSAVLTNLNIYGLLAVGIVLAAIRAILLYLLLARGRDFAARVSLWPLVLAFTFSTSQISIFEHPFSSSTINLSLLGLTIGLCGVAWFPDRRRGAALMLGGGVLAAWSFGSGLLAWPIMLLGLWLRGVRRRGPYLALLGGLLVTALPYAVLLIIAPESADTAAPAPWRILLAPIVLIGFPLAQDFSRLVAGVVGLLVLAMASVALIALWRRGKRPLKPSTAVAVLLLTFGALAAAQLGLFRGRTASWYTYVGMIFWLGLGALLLSGDITFDWLRPGKRRFADPAPVRSVTLAALTILYLTSNLTYADKSFFLQTRSPAAESCVRAYRTAPAICDQLLRAYPGNWSRDYLAGLSSILERHRLAAFAPRQEWTLQGEFGLGNVRVEPESGAATWSPDRASAAAPWTDYRHLDLVVHNAGRVGWTITLPETLRHATLHTAIATDHTANRDGMMTFTITITDAAGLNRTASTEQIMSGEDGWRAIALPLEEYAGKRITIWLATEGCAEPTCQGRYQYPTVTIELPH
jgi:hypothetical protein